LYVKESWGPLGVSSQNCQIIGGQTLPGKHALKQKKMYFQEKSPMAEKQKIGVQSEMQAPKVEENAFCSNVLFTYISKPRKPSFVYLLRGQPKM